MTITSRGARYLPKEGVQTIPAFFRRHYKSRQVNYSFSVDLYHSRSDVGEIFTRLSLFFVGRHYLRS